jgi:hypothetical protein
MFSNLLKIYLYTGLKKRLNKIIQSLHDITYYQITLSHHPYTWKNYECLWVANYSLFQVNVAMRTGL